MNIRLNFLFQNTVARYLFGVVAIIITFALRIWLTPLTGTGAPFVLFFGAILLTSLLAGTGPGICAVLLSIFLTGYEFVVPAGYPVFQATFQSLLFGVDGIVVVYLTHLMTNSREAVQDANRQLRNANAEIRRAEAHTRDSSNLHRTHSFWRISMRALPTSIRQHAGHWATIGTNCSAKQFSTSFRQKMRRA
jgi:K+-sensing histidine kinase KdpD